MRKSLFISFLLVACFNNGIAQKTKKNKKVLVYSPLRTFFQQNPSLKEIEIYRWEPGGCNRFTVKSTDSTLNRQYFDLCFEGDKYLFEKKFGKWNFPDSLITPLIDNKADYWHATVNIRYDSVFIATTHEYYSKEEFFFGRIRDSIWYIKGIAALEKELQAGIQHISAEEKLTDSVFYFTAILKKDSTITVEKQITSENETYAKAITKVLNRSYPWKPYMHGGMRLKYYMRIYIRINEDRTVRVDYRQP
jgi:hypothetical protein